MRKSALALLLAVALASALAPSNRITLPYGKQLFVSGMNLAWINYGADVGDVAIDTNTFKFAVQDVRDSGGNAMRVWLSTNGGNDPKFSATDSLVTGPGTQTVANVKKMLDIARRNGVVLSLTLLTHNFMESGQIGVNIGYNRKLLQTDAGITAYVNNYVTPLVTAVGLDSALLCWEIFNEPEGMVTGIGWTAQRIAKTDVQKVVNRVTGAIHRAVPGVLVSNGAVTFASAADVEGNSNWYTDAALKAVGGDNDGTLDFYMVHYYPWNGAKYSPFTKANSFWALDKPLVVAEFPAASWSQAIVTAAGSNKTVYDAAGIDTLYSHLYNTGYAGAMSWCYMGDNSDPWLGSFSTVKAPMKALYDSHLADIKLKDVTRASASGNGVLQMTYVNADNTVWTNLHKDSTFNLTGKGTISVDVLIPTSATGSFKVHWVLKTGSTWRWDISDTYCTIPADSAWHTCTADLTTIHYYSDATQLAPLAQVHSIILHFSTADSFSGKVWFDNVKLGSTVLYNFDDGRPVFAVDTYSANEASKVTGLDAVLTGGATPILAAPALASKTPAVLRSKDLVQLQFPTAGARSISLHDLQGNELGRAESQGSVMTFSLPAEGVMVLQVREPDGSSWVRTLAPGK